MLPELPVYSFQPNLGGLLSLVITLLIPLAVGFITKPSVSSGWKAALLLLLAAVKTFVEAWIAAINNSVEFNLIAVLMNVVVAFVFAVGVHFGLLRPTGISDKVQSSGVK